MCKTSTCQVDYPIKSQLHLWTRLRNPRGKPRLVRTG